MEKGRKFLPLIHIIISVSMARNSVRACVLGSREFVGEECSAPKFIYRKQLCRGRGRKEPLES